jgi:hypothetical protein
MKNRRGLLQLEGLTERIVPAVSIRAMDGDLVISGIHNTGGQGLAISVSGPNEVTITDGTKLRGQYAVSGDLILNLSNRADTVTIDFAATGTLDGGITANLGNGNDSLTITNSGNDNAVISGAIVVDGGNGNDSLIITNDGTTSTLSIDGAVTFNGQAGSDTISINGTADAIQPIVIGNGLNLTRVNVVNVASDTTTTGINVTISGNVVINASSDKLIANTVTMGGTKGEVAIAGAFTVTGGQGLDTVTLEDVHVGDVVPAEDEVIEVSFNLDRGANTLDFTGVEMGIVGTDVDFLYTGGTGADTINWSGGTNSFSGDVTLNLSNGTNIVDGAATTDFDADVTINGGKNGDAIDLDTGDVLGLLSLSLGAGTNSLDAGGALDGGLTYVGGANADTVTLTSSDEIAGDVSISVGAGVDVVDISGTGAVIASSMIIDLGVDSALDTLDYDNEFDSLITILNEGSGDSVTSTP